MSSSDFERKQLFNRIYSDYSGKIYNFVMRITHGDDYLAEEITQMVFVKLWERFGVIRNKEALLSYMFTAARNCFIKYCKHELVEHIYTMHIMHHTESFANYTDDYVNDAFLKSIMKRAIEELPPQRQKVFRKGKIEGKTIKEIANDMHLSENTVERHMALAMKQMKQSLGKYYYYNNVLMLIVWTASLLCTI